MHNTPAADASLKETKPSIDFLKIFRAVGAGGEPGEGRTAEIIVPVDVIKKSVFDGIHERLRTQDVMRWMVQTTKSCHQGGKKSVCR